jgi:hypothetical protein
MTTQHYRITLEEAKNLYKSGILTSKGLIYSYLRIHQAPGWKRHYTPREIWEELEISKSSFYKAIADLENARLIKFETPNGIEIEIVSDPGNESEIVDSQSEIVDSQSKIVENKSPKPAHSKEKGDSPDYIKLDQIDPKSLSRSEEREKFKNFCQKKADELPKPPTLLERWIQNNFEELWNQYQKTSEGNFTPPPEDEEKIEQAIEAKKAGKIKDLFYSQFQKCTCIVEQGGKITPLEEWQS